MLRIISLSALLAVASNAYCASFGENKENTGKQICQCQQDTVTDSHRPYIGEIELGGNSKYQGMRPMYTNLNFGAEIIKNVMLTASYQYQMNFYRTSGIKTYARNHALGAGISYRILRSSKTSTASPWWNSNDYLAVRARYFRTVGNADWHNSVYEAGLVYYLMYKHSMNYSVSLGYRFMKSHSANFGDYRGVTVSVGIGI